MANNTTYAPRPILFQRDVWEWSDRGGRYLNLRRLPNGELSVYMHAPEAAHPSLMEQLEVDQWPTIQFHVAKPDVQGFLESLAEWTTRWP